MTTETQNEQQGAILMGAVIDLMTETQTILQLLVKHDIVTREEVVETRTKVNNQPKYQAMRNAVAQHIVDNEDRAKFEELLEKSFQLKGSNNLTPEEKDYLLNKLNSLR